MKQINSEDLKFEKKIGEGAYGVVYRVSSGGGIYAMKIEKTVGTLDNEIRALRLLAHPSIPKILAQGAFRGHCFIILPYFKISMVQILRYDPEFFNSKMIAAITWNLVDILQQIHSKGMIYRDLKPDNIMIGLNNKIYLVDFGMCIMKSEFQRGKLAGTLRYISINAHIGSTLGFGDDFESLGYLIVFLLKGTLPWMNESKNEIILEMKMNFENYCEGLNREREWKTVIETFMDYKNGKEIEHGNIKSLLLYIINSQDTGASLFNCHC